MCGATVVSKRDEINFSLVIHSRTREKLISRERSCVLECITRVKVILCLFEIML